MEMSSCGGSLAPLAQTTGSAGSTRTRSFLRTKNHLNRRYKHVEYDHSSREPLLRNLGKESKTLKFSIKNAASTQHLKLHRHDVTDAIPSSPGITTAASQPLAKP